MESSIFAREYMIDPSIIDNNDEFIDEVGHVMGTGVKLSLEYEQVARYLFETHKDVEEWKK